MCVFVFSWGPQALLYAAFFEWVRGKIHCQTLAPHGGQAGTLWRRHPPLDGDHLAEYVKGQRTNAT